MIGRGSATLSLICEIPLPFAWHRWVPKGWSGLFMTGRFRPKADSGQVAVDVSTLDDLVTAQR